MIKQEGFISDEEVAKIEAVEKPAGFVSDSEVEAMEKVPGFVSDAEVAALEIDPYSKIKPRIVGDQNITNKELDHYAKKYGTDSELLREYANWAGANTEMREGITGFGGWQEFKDSLKKTAGGLGNELGFGLNKIVAKKLLSDDEGFRKAADEINALSSRKKSYLSDVTEIGSQVATGGALSKGAQAASKLPAMARKLYDPITAVTGAASAGLGSSQEGRELEQTLESGAYGALGYGALATVGKGLGKLSKNADILPDEALPIAKTNEPGKLAKGLDKHLGALSTRIGNISPDMKYSLRKFEFDTSTKTAKLNNSAEPFLKEMKDLDPPIKAEVTKHLYNGELDKAQRVMKETSPKMAKEFETTIRPMLDEIGDNLAAAGHTFDKVPDYFPRIVKDYKALRSELGLEEQGVITQQLAAYAKKKKTSVANLSSEEKTKIIDLALQGYKQVSVGGKPKFAKQRMIAEVDDNMLKHYAEPEESLASYIRSSTHDIEKRKFFGVAGSRDAAVFDEVGNFDMDGSIGKLVTEGIEEGRIPPAREQELYDMVQARFIGENQSPGALGQTVRDLGYMGTIANPISTITQLGDLGVSAGLKGFGNTIEAMFSTKNIKTTDLGLDNLVSKEFAVGDGRKTVKLLNDLMGVAGFKAIDKLGKETFINAAILKAQKSLKTMEGEARFRQEVGPIFKGETDQFINDLKAGDMTENVKLWTFNELADTQPIALSEMPEAYLRAKDGRLLYMLKSFTLKQLDVVRRTVVQEWKAGNKQKAVKQAALLAGYVSAANVGTQTVKDILLGRDVRAEDVPGKALWSLLGAYGLNEYTFSKYVQKGDVVKGVAAYVTPATPVIDAAFTLGSAPFTDDPKLEQTLRAVPFVGPLVYSWFGGGAERYNERLRKNKGQPIRKREVRDRGRRK